MARIQILRLPEVIVGELHETPFILVIDQTTGDEDWHDLDALASQTGARSVIVSEYTLDVA